MSDVEDVKLRRFRADMRRAVADYISSEGCDCCRGSDHAEHRKAIAKLLHVRPHPEDPNWYDFNKYRSKEK